MSIPKFWDYSRFPREIPLNRMDPTIPTTSAGKVVARQENPFVGGLEVVTHTWTWQLTLEPDAGR